MDNINKDNFIGALRWKAIECDCVHVQPGSNGFSTLLAKRTKRKRLLFCTYTTRPYATGTNSRIYIEYNWIQGKKNGTLGKFVQYLHSENFKKLFQKIFRRTFRFKFYYFAKNLFLNILKQQKKNSFFNCNFKNLMYKKNQRIFFLNTPRIPKKIHTNPTDLHSNAQHTL